jgi:hypothetical protein
MYALIDHLLRSGNSRQSAVGGQQIAGAFLTDSFFSLLNFFFTWDIITFAAAKISNLKQL